MHGLTRPTPRDWLRGSLIGTGLGAVILGIGGRVAMRGIAVLSGAPPGFSVGGSVTVVFMGAVAGLVGALILMGLRFFLPRRWLIQTLTFYAAIVLITLRGLRPVDTQRLFIFLPLVLIYGFLLRVFSRPSRTILASVVTVLSLACAPAVQTGPAGAIAPIRPTMSIDRATWQARATFTSALQTADTPRVAALFALEAFLIAPGGDSIRGPDEIARYLARLGQDGAEVDVSFGREGSLESCVGAAREQLAYSARFRRRDGTPGVASGNLAVFWRVDSTGELRIAWIAFPAAETRRRLTRHECPSVDAAAWQARRWAVSVSVGGGCSCKVRAPGFTPDSKWAVVVPYNLVTVQRPVRRHVVAEIVTGLISSAPTTGTRYYPNRDYGLTRIGHSAGFLAALVAYEHRGIQVGGGPIVQLAHWRLRDSLVPFSTGGLPSYHDTTWSHVSIGIVGDVRYSVLVGSRTFMTFHAQLRRFPHAKIPDATPRLSTALDQSTSLFGIDFGVIF